MDRRLKHRIEEAILAVIILVNVGDFFNLVSDDIRFLKTIISWTLIGYLLMKVKLMRILFGTDRPGIDAAIIFSCFLLVFKNLIHVSAQMVDGAHLMLPIASIIVEWRVQLEMFSFISGALLLIIISGFLAMRLPIKQPSLMHVIHEEGPPPAGVLPSLKRFLSIASVLMFFFIVVFNFALEWIGMLVDTPLVLLAIVFYLFVVIRHHERFHVDHFIFKVGNFGEAFYERFISLFRYKETVFLGISGMLVLHLISEVGTYAIPLLGIREVSYFLEIEGSHMPLIGLFKEGVIGSALHDAGLGLLYLGNILWLIFFLLLPTFIWYKVYRKEGFKVTHIEISLFYFSCVCYALFPLFHLVSLSETGVAGVNIITGQFGSRIGGMMAATVSALTAGVLSYALSYSHWMKERLLAGGIIIMNAFFAWYLSLFSLGLAKNYIGLISMSFGPMIGWFGRGILAVFLGFSMAFYIGGFLIFLWETIKEYRYVR